MELNKDTVVLGTLNKPRSLALFGLLIDFREACRHVLTPRCYLNGVSLETTQSKGSKLLGIPWLLYLKAQRSILVKSDLKEEYGLVAGVSF